MADWGWEFRDPALLDAAARGVGRDFQRLEFLGDAVAQAVVVPWVYRWSAGSVAVIGGAWQHLLGDRNLGYLASVSGVQRLLDPVVAAIAERPGDAVEALIGAAYVDGGWEAATAVCEYLLGEWLRRPEGVVADTARVDTETLEARDGWCCRYELWRAGFDQPVRGEVVGSTRLDAEIAGLVDALAILGREARYVWIEAGVAVRAALRDPWTAEGTDVRAALALLAAYDGVWYLPGGEVRFAEDLVADARTADGRLTEFESVVGRDLVRSELERFATRPGGEQRRLTVVGDAVLKAATGIRVFTRFPVASEGDLTVMRHRILALDRINEIALRHGLAASAVPTARPARLHDLVRSALGVVAVDAGPAVAVDLADRWLDHVQMDGSPSDDVIAITVTSTPWNPQIDVVLTTPTVTSTWTLIDPDAHWTTVGLEGVAAALDAIPAGEESQAVLLVAPRLMIELFDGSYAISVPETARVVARVRDRIERRNLAVVCAVAPAVRRSGA